MTLDGMRGGLTFDFEKDYKRLNKQMLRVFTAMFGTGWKSLAMISNHTHDPESSVSARLRDFRKQQFGGHAVGRMRQGNTYFYKLAWNPEVKLPTAEEIENAWKKR